MGPEGLLCVLKRRLHRVQAQQAAAGLDESSSEEENMARNFSTEEIEAVCFSSTVPPAASAPDANLLSPSHQAADLD
ncbi:unnamed protein product [Pleuronectes platessa]|uniref:Uncharacterized protein n=1 Tax=Pleuronectes platessa TaxID=8262 RepID=A0A9N7V4T3_PLEPL|nr:unnamed protein product [Pleuronectes platessa]